MKQVFLIIATLFAFTAAFAQELNPVEWSFEKSKNDDGTYNLVFTATIESDWFIYSQFLGDDGPIPTSFHLKENPNIELIGSITESGTVKKEGFDKLFEMNLVKYGGTATFTQKVKLRNDTDSISGYLVYMTCDDTRCLPPTEVSFNF